LQLAKYALTSDSQGQQKDNRLGAKIDVCWVKVCDQFGSDNSATCWSELEDVLRWCNIFLGVDPAVTRFSVVELVGG